MSCSVLGGFYAQIPIAVRFLQGWVPFVLFLAGRTRRRLWRRHYSGFRLLPTPPPTRAPRATPTGPPARPIRPPMTAPAIVFDARFSFLRSRERGGLVLPCHPLAVFVVRSDFSRLQSMHAAKRLFPWSVPPLERGSECSTSHAPFLPGRA